MTTKRVRSKMWSGNRILPHQRQVVRVYLIIGTLFATGGCGNGLAEVSGVVSIDGQPVIGGPQGARVTVQFQPADGLGSTAIGLADAEGRYVIATGSQTGIAPGEYIVSCAASELVAGGVRSLVDRKYANAKTSGLSFSVQPGSNEFNIALTSAPPVRRVP